MGETPASDIDILDRLYAVVESRRRDGDPDASYTARLFARGTAKIAQKVGEEAVEAVIEAMRGDHRALAEESADLLFHLLVLWADAGLSLDDIRGALAAREGVGGFDHKKGLSAPKPTTAKP